MMEFILVKLQTIACSVQTATQLETGLNKDYIRDVCWKLAVLTRIFWEKTLWCTVLSFSYNDNRIVDSPQFYKK